MTLNEIFEKYIAFIHCSAYEKSKKINKIIDEPSFISSFIENHKLLEEYLNKHSPGTYYIVDAVYAHQTPKVIPDGSTKSVEIADLLIININHSSLQNPTTGNAILFQAKRNSLPCTGSLAAENENIQFQLYKKWPEFTFKNRIEHSNGSAYKWNFNLNKNLGEEQSKYIVIYKGEIFTARTSNLCPQFMRANFISNSPWNSSVCEDTTNTSNLGLTCSESFAATLAGIISGRHGRPFDTSDNITKDDWSDFIQKMLQLAVNQSYTYNLSRQNIKNNRRGVSISSSFLKSIAMLTFKHEIMNLDVYNNYLKFNYRPFFLTNILLHKSVTDNNSMPPPMNDDIVDRMPPSHPSMLIINAFNKQEFNPNY
ncbi:hypothetical protein [Rahnella sp. AN3-3W3]|uniref:hypothetical protein n=1 Tax=Rahnella sp. AN3-3W3 TaxID=1610578 RepID=UPI000DD43D17|nr:hypothetical protein [Rahnella sp. AN3-3W3]